MINTFSRLQNLPVCLVWIAAGFITIPVLAMEFPKAAWPFVFFWTIVFSYLACPTPRGECEE